MNEEDEGLRGDLVQVNYAMNDLHSYHEDIDLRFRAGMILCCDTNINWRHMCQSGCPFRGIVHPKTECTEQGGTDRGAAAGSLATRIWTSARVLHRFPQYKSQELCVIIALPKF